MAEDRWIPIEIDQRWRSDDGDLIVIVGSDLLTNRWIVRDEEGAIRQMNAAEIRSKHAAVAPGV